MFYEVMFGIDESITHPAWRLDRDSLSSDDSSYLRWNFWTQI